MSDVVVLLELEPSTEVLDAGEVDVGARIRWVHAAPPDPGRPGRPGPVTFCGLDTRDLEREPYRPAGPGATWYPPSQTTRHCLACDSAVRSR
ncbi:hypothetical protein [Kitasatospora sp. NPDC059571]|uniref:hypothetical protein n=1 Tax=Kitasatospora sp. NPDC059571 TaxID=3346871 RepID=UPI003698F490